MPVIDELIRLGLIEPHNLARICDKLLAKLRKLSEKVT